MNAAVAHHSVLFRTWEDTSKSKIMLNGFNFGSGRSRSADRIFSLTWHPKDGFTRMSVSTRGLFSRSQEGR